MNKMWNIFEKTGNIQAYVLYKELEKRNELSSSVEVPENADKNRRDCLAGAQHGR